MEKSTSGWNAYWGRKGLMPILSTVYRRVFAQAELRKQCDREFAEQGIFFEAGCGSGEASQRIPRRRRRFVGIDMAPAAAARARTLGFYDELIVADILRLPMADGTVDGGWNVGVMEHFPAETMPRAFSELLRVLKPGGKLCLFWPHTLSPTHLVFWTVERAIQSVRPSFHFFPPSPSMLTPFNHDEIRALFRSAGAREVAFELSLRGAAVHYLVTVTK